MDQTFVSREAELSSLGCFLDKVLNGNTQICFVTGEAGIGKTYLIEEFVRQSEHLDENLLFVKGNCNAQSGISDPYLPFRGILRKLSGDNTNAITSNNAQRIGSILRTSGRALVEVAPELVGALVPGAGIFTALARMGAKEKGWLKVLEEQAQVSEQQATDIKHKQLEIFYQYTAFLRDLAKTYSLVLILEDMQWIDATSNALFFHLARELKDSSILLIGTYRPNDVSLGRNNDRHPLEQTLNEVKRMYGNIRIDLDASLRQNGRNFLEALVNSQPNHLSAKFIDTLFARTGGHALFTTELLYSMQKRGDLIRDANGLWQESSQLDWESLPARVEAVIEERIGRLEDDLREILDVACVEGQDFTAQVIAKTQHLKERKVIHNLSHELERCHGLVQESGEIQVGDTFLSRYTFNHALFQAYLYNELSTAERRLFHSQVAGILESLYADKADTIAVQLALHYNKARNREKSSIYLEKAGDQAFALGEFEIARQFFERALKNIGIDENKEKRMQKAHLLRRIGETYYNTGRFDLAECQYRCSLELSRELQDNENVSYTLSSLAKCLRHRRETDEALKVVQEALDIAQRVGDRKLESRALWVNGVAYKATDRIDERRACYEKALEIAYEIGDIQREMACLNSLGVIDSVVLGDFDKAIEYYNRALEIAIQQKRLSAQSTYMCNLSAIYRKLGNYVKAEEFRSEALKLRERLGNIPATSLSYETQGIIHLHLGNIGASVESLKESIDIADRFKRLTVQVDSRSRLLLVYLIQDNLEAAQHLNSEIEPLLDKYQTKSAVFNQMLLNAILELRLGQLEESKIHFEQVIAEAVDPLPAQRWSSRYHHAFAQAGLVLLTPLDQEDTGIAQVIELFREAIDICGWVGTLDDALLILREMQKADLDNTLEPIETYLLEKREIAWNNRAYSD